MVGIMQIEYTFVYTGINQEFNVCIICLEYKKNKDLVDARRMLEAAKREIKVIDISEKHLKEIEAVLDYKEKHLKDKT